MKKSLISALGLAFALAVSMPILSISTADAATKPAAPAATTTTTAPASDAMTKKKPVKKHVVKACKVTKKHKCPVKHKKHTAKKAAPKKAY
ncbi:hypothetical protein RFM68_15695 [Mesorhizobium sp. MSK_1335]|uniref:Acid shock protein n=1 Tax=Mesorhizobium montanum TaxID=3072323 RepID=A0ABU4ZKP5_9HYPH|nr:hypothetical protein [Mesorhizobium sp. MSK_1335]MDX8525946.1 hypothetical protein [Mesorhizobium sp. MSK_1335]